MNNNKSYQPNWEKYKAITPHFVGRKIFDPIKIETITPYINWRLFFKQWGYPEKFASVKNISMCGHCKAQWFAAFKEVERETAIAASELYDEAFLLLQKLINIDAEYIKAIFVIGKAFIDNNNIFFNGTPIVIKEETEQQLIKKQIAPKDANKENYIGAFAVTAGAGADYLLNKYKHAGETHKALVLEHLLKVLAQATTEWLYEKIRNEYWGYANNEDFIEFKAIIGSHDLPNKSILIDLNKLLQIEDIYVSLNEDGEMTPTASVSGFFFVHPANK